MDNGLIYELVVWHLIWIRDDAGHEHQEEIRGIGFPEVTVVCCTGVPGGFQEAQLVGTVLAHRGVEKGACRKVMHMLRKCLHGSLSTWHMRGPPVPNSAKAWVQNHD